MASLADYTSHSILKYILKYTNHPRTIAIRGDSLSKYEKFPKKLTFLTSWYAHVRLLENFAHILNGCPLKDLNNILILRFWNVSDNYKGY